MLDGNVHDDSWGFFIAGVHTISRRTLTAPTTSSSAGNYRIIAEKLLGPLQGPARPSAADLRRGNAGQKKRRFSAHCSRSHAARGNEAPGGRSGGTGGSGSGRAGSV
ncbi:uncharacterized protein LOC116853807 [Odontomachus brunneus]|uniref:uncharacterized protein LOC116853807 n=1 Tax=Odontomachus brunneus TaxID=486640 RepID=UPI0013F1EACF|nr:uncharacterized protein LOC116853807 [Odontomachus brunneus]